MWHKKIIFLIVYLFIITYNKAQDKLKNINISGEVEADYISYFENEDQKINGRNQTLLLLNLKSAEESKFQYFTSIEIREDFSDKSRERMYLKESYFTLKNKFIEVTTGKQIIEWGQSDKIKPVDNICPIDYSDFIDNEKIGVLSINSTLYSKAGNIQGVFIPVFSESLLPLINSRWFLNQPELISEKMGNKKYSYSLKSLNRPENDIRSHQFAFQYEKSLAGFDITLNYYNGYSHIYENLINTSIVSPDSVHFVFFQNFYKQQVCGGSFSRVLGKYGVRAEGAYFIPDGILNNIDYLRYSVGIDRTFYDIIGYNSLFVLLQWMDEYSDDDENFSNYDINHLFRQSLLFKLDFSMGMFANIILQGIYNFNANDYCIQPSVKYNFGDGVNLYCNIDITGGDKESFYSYFKNNRIQFKMSYSF